MRGKKGESQRGDNRNKRKIENNSEKKKYN